MITVTVPKLGEMTSSVILVEWLVARGDRVEEGNPLAVVETDKVDSEIVAPSSGVVVELLAEPDAELDVGAAVCVIDDSIESER